MAATALLLLGSGLQLGDALATLAVMTMLTTLMTTPGAARRGLMDLARLCASVAGGTAHAGVSA